MIKNNTVLIKLILQVLDEPREIFGYYGRFAKVFGQYTGITFNRTKVQQWQTKGIPKKFLPMLEELSRKHAKSHADVITAEELKTGIFKSKSDHPHRLITIHFAGITLIGEITMWKLFLSAIASIKLTPTTVNGVVKPVENVRYSSSDISIVTVDEHGNLVAVGLGKATITITADAQIGEGATEITNTIEIEVTPELAVALNPTLHIHQAGAATSETETDSTNDDCDSGDDKLQSQDSEQNQSADESPSESSDSNENHDDTTA